MKTRLIILTILSLGFVFAANAQEIESDDMYFNSKDREKLIALNQSRQVAAKKKKEEQRSQREEDYNPTDSYSARNVNPEYTSRAQSQTSQEDDENYFVNNYQYSTQSNLNRWNNNYSNWYNNPWYTSSYCGSCMYGWNSPYYGSYYDAWGSPWYNPYRSGWSASLSYRWGNPYSYGWNSWNSGWGMSYGYGGWYDPWNSWGPSFYNPYYGYGYPTRVIVVENGNYKGPVYGKRSSRSSAIADRNDNTSRVSRSSSSNPGGRIATSETNNNGRVRTTSTSNESNAQPAVQEEYYNRSWSSRQQTRPSNSGSSNTGRTSTWTETPSRNTRTMESNTRSSWGGGSNSNSNNSYSPSRSSGSNSSYSPSRSSSGSSGSGGSRSSSRGGRGGN